MCQSRAYALHAVVACCLGFQIMEHAFCFYFSFVPASCFGTRGDFPGHLLHVTVATNVTIATPKDTLLAPKRHTYTNNHTQNKMDMKLGGTNRNSYHALL